MKHKSIQPKRCKFINKDGYICNRVLRCHNKSGLCNSHHKVNRQKTYTKQWKERQEAESKEC